MSLRSMFALGLLRATSAVALGVGNVTFRVARYAHATPGLPPRRLRDVLARAARRGAARLLGIPMPVVRAPREGDRALGLLRGAVPREGALEPQKAAIEAWAKDHGITVRCAPLPGVPMTVADLHEMVLDLCLDEEVSLLVVRDLSRLGRDARDVQRLIDLLEDHGIFVAVTEGPPASREEETHGPWPGPA